MLYVFVLGKAINLTSFLNTNSPSCKLPEKSKQFLKGLKVHYSKKKYKTSVSIAFGSVEKVEMGQLTWLAFSEHQQKTYLDNVASVTMFKSISEVEKSSYVGRSDIPFQVATGYKAAPCNDLTMVLKKLSTADALYIADLNDTPVGVGHICDYGRWVVFTKNDAVISSLREFSAT